ncbi:MAG: glycosyltransferase family 4 protein [Flavobacteriaceae bacterium]|nr:glycosyltransferase family 4 protein [Flavobacteriaceae bacterium]
MVHYRVSFFEQLKARLASVGIELKILVGEGSNEEMLKKENDCLSWAISVKTRYVFFDKVCLLGVSRHIVDADLIIFPQENKLLPNYIGSILGTKKVAFWGHGKNFQSLNENGLLEQIKARLISRVDWWFAYTNLTLNVLKDVGYPENRVTVVNNTIDIQKFSQELLQVTNDELEMLGIRYGINMNSQVGLYCGSLYKEKRLDTLLRAADRIHEELPEFVLFIIGDGPQVALVKHASKARSWLKLTGSLRGRQKAIHFRLANVILNPGLVGLNIIDGFCAGLPTITLRDSKHSPEISYLEDGVNGLVIDGGANEYARAVTYLFNNQTVLTDLSSNAMQSSKKYSMNEMVKRFSEGIERAISNLE